jgi:hypothetical protein
MSSENTSPLLSVRPRSLRIQAPFFFVERILGLTPKVQHSTTDVNRLLVFLEWFHAAVPTPFVVKLHKLTVGLSANHHPM